MRVLYWTPYFLPDIGGVEVLSASLIPPLTARGHEFMILASYGDLGQDTLSEFVGMPVRRMNFEAALAQRDVKRLTQIVRDVTALKQDFRPDIIHLNTYGAGAFFHLHTRAHFPASELYSVHALHGDASANSLLGRCLQSARQVVAVSQAMLEGAIALVPEVRAKSRLILNGLPMPDLPPTPLDFSSPTLLVSGRAVPDKGFDLALQAFARLRKSVANVRLLVAGDGAELVALRDLAVELGIANTVEFLGWVRPSDMPAVINRATIVLVPSRWNEPFGLVALEAAQMGRPVVATRVGGLPEVVRDGDAGLLVEREDVGGIARAVESLLRNPDLCQVMGDKARLRASQNFGLEKMVDAYDSLYCQMGSEGEG